MQDVLGSIVAAHELALLHFFKHGQMIKNAGREARNLSSPACCTSRVRLSDLRRAYVLVIYEEMQQGSGDRAIEK